LETISYLNSPPTHFILLIFVLKLKDMSILIFIDHADSPLRRPLEALSYGGSNYQTNRTSAEGVLLGTAPLTWSPWVTGNSKIHGFRREL
jgi:hypothetical protein